MSTYAAVKEAVDGRSGILLGTVAGPWSNGQRMYAIRLYDGRLIYRFERQIVAL